MNIRRRNELLIVGFSLAIIVVALIPALFHARQEQRDGIRRAELVAFKGVLERYFNEHEQYPLTFDASPHQYVVEQEVAGGAERWYLRAELENTGTPVADLDLEHNVYYRVVREGDTTYYDICGGENRCGVAAQP